MSGQKVGNRGSMEVVMSRLKKSIIRVAMMALSTEYQWISLDTRFLTALNIDMNQLAFVIADIEYIHTSKDIARDMRRG